MAAASVPKLYKSVIEDVINNVREAFLDEGVDEQILIELKQTWEKKLSESKALEPREQDVSQMSAQQSSFRQQQHNASQHSSQVATSHIVHQQQQINNSQQSRHTSLTHQLTLPAGNMVPQALLQYTSDNNESQKSITVSGPQKMTITLPAQLTQGGIHTVMSAPAAAAHLALPAEVTASLLQQAALSQGGILNAAQAQALQAAANAAGQNRPTLLIKPNERYQGVQVTQSGGQQGSGIIQLDGANDTSDEDASEEDFGDNDDDRDDNDDEQNDNEDDFLGEEEDPLNSEDDVSEDDPSELFETDNVVVCQYDKITRSRNRWKFHLKDGIMNLQGRDFVFQKAVGDAEW